MLTMSSMHMNDLHKLIGKSNQGIRENHELGIIPPNSVIRNNEYLPCWLGHRGAMLLYGISEAWIYCKKTP
jgi:hypothetical protein